MTQQLALQSAKSRLQLQRKIHEREALIYEPTGRVRQIIERLAARKALENELYFVITYLYGLATSYCSLLDMFTYVAQSEFKRCGRLFDRVKVLAKTWQLGYVNALETVAKNTKSPLLKDFLERFSEMLKTGEMYEKFLMMEHEAYVVAYEAEYERSLKNVENLGNCVFGNHYLHYFRDHHTHSNSSALGDKWRFESPVHVFHACPRARRYARSIRIRSLPSDSSGRFHLHA